MNNDYLKEQASRVRALAERADPFTKRRLLDLAERYDGRKSARQPTPLPSVDLDNKEHSEGGDPS
jgi:hypothetical protein